MLSMHPNVHVLVSILTNPVFAQLVQCEGSMCSVHDLVSMVSMVSMVSITIPCNQRTEASED